jgi:hypothetical protein
MERVPGEKLVLALDLVLSRGFNVSFFFVAKRGQMQ